MILLNGKFSAAKVFTDDIDETSISQIISILNSPISENTNVRFMPDVHAGAGAVIGTTITLGDKIIPNLIGVDIGCGVLAAKLNTVEVDFEKLDYIIRNNIPSGRNVRDNVDIEYIRNIYQRINNKIPWEHFLSELKNIANKVGEDGDYMLNSLGTLGGGNHFIEVDKSDNNIYLTVHSGSRHFGLKIAKYYQDLAKTNLLKDRKKEIIEQLKKEGKEKLIEATLNKIRKEQKQVPSGLEYLEGDPAHNYLHDMNMAQIYASLNRKIIIDQIVNKMNWLVLEYVESIHNYIDFEDKIIRKGAIRSHKNEKLIIPLNMRDGVIIGYGKSNPDWNYSAPHGAGRKLSRNEARKKISLEEFKNSMRNIYTTSVDLSTIDEAPFAYKDSNKIIELVKESVDVIDILKPIYNFKASE